MRLFLSYVYTSESEKNDDDSRTDILFDRLMLMELRENVSKLDATAYAELKSYKVWLLDTSY